MIFPLGGGEVDCRGEPVHDTVKEKKHASVHRMYLFMDLQYTKHSLFAIRTAAPAIAPPVADNSWNGGALISRRPLPW